MHRDRHLSVVSGQWRIRRARSTDVQGRRESPAYRSGTQHPEPRVAALSPLAPRPWPSSHRPPPPPRRCP
ncbi:MAG: hypothetical protein MZV64_13910 [Ignavibacteriales bacterium]|nr:hypothetical protein [Ignavibacteriales bacterium]